jgi:MSHA biogenesis protein MshI
MECRVFSLLKRAATVRGRIGLALLRDQIAIAVVRREGSAPPVLERCELLPLPSGPGSDPFAAALKDAGLPRMAVSSVLQPGDYQLALVEAPDVPPAELRAAMRWRLKEAIDFRVEDAIIDVFEVPAQTRGGQGRMMYAVAARRGVIERISGALAHTPGYDVIDVPELCLRNLVALLPAAASGIALLHLGELAASVIIVRGTTFYFARQMDLQATLHIGAGHDSATARVDSASVVLELQRSLDYYERHFDQPPITHLVVAPGGPRSETLAADLARETGFDVLALDLNSALACATPVPMDVQTRCLLAVGAALREERRTL